MCHDLRACKMMWHHLRQSRNWFWLQNSGHENSCIWVNAGSISLYFDLSLFVRYLRFFSKTLESLHLHSPSPFHSKQLIIFTCLS
ncbi:hypothetical protein Hanom_Chr09g00797221 [Helianthus anomalus]